MMKKRAFVLLFCIAMLLNMSLIGAMGANPDYQGVGPLMDVPEMPMVSLFTMNETLAEEAESNGNKVEITNPEGTITATKEVTYTGNVTNPDSTDPNDQDPIYQISLSAETISNTTGESCDFVLVLDMSYSMTGANLIALKDACTTFVKDLYEMSRYSRVAIVTYGGDCHANQYYITPYNNTANKTNAVLTCDSTDNVVVYQKLTGNTDYAAVNDQHWYIRHNEADDTYVNVINMGNGESLNVAGSVTQGQSTNVQTSPVSEADAQKWKLIQNKDGSYALLSKLVDSNNGNRTFNLDVSNGKTEDKTNVIVWNANTDSYTIGGVAYTEASNPQKWYLEPVYSDTAYETYYWTDTTNEEGYSYRTTDAAADSSLLLVSQNEGKEINDKLLAAIDALEVYGEAHEGSHPGEAMEKAARIMQAVKIEDANDYCEATDEYYYNCKRGVLYFADGVPSPVDDVDLYNYPNNDAEALATYGVPYKFVENYKDIQDALNWGKVLKADRGVEIPAVSAGYDNNGNSISNKEAFDMYYINTGGIHEYSEYVDLGGSTVTGCGATVYVLSINLQTIDVTLEGENCTRTSHQVKGSDGKYYSTTEHKYVTVKTESGEEKTICVNAVNDPNFFYDSFDSRSNEYFYRLSSHRKDGSHVSFGDPNARTEAQELWHDAFIDTNQAKTHGWNGRYPDFLCRNQENSYFVACDDQKAVKEAFQGIAMQTAKALKNLSMIDRISEYFVICDKDGNPLEIGDRILADGTLLSKEAENPTDMLFGTVQYDKETGCQYMLWENFDLIPGDGSGAGRKDFYFAFNVVPKEGFIGGNKVVTNAGASLLDKDGKPLIELENPEVDVEIKTEIVWTPNINCYLGQDALENVTIAVLDNYVNFSVNGFDLDLTKPDYGLDWQDDYVNITVQFKDENGNIVSDGFGSVTADQTYTVELIVEPKYEGAKTSREETSEGTLYVFHPVLTFKDDTTHYYGQALSELSELENDCYVNLQWYSPTLNRYAGDPGVLMNAPLGYRPEINFDCIPEAGESTILPKDTIGANVEVSKIGYLTGNVTEYCEFRWQACEGNTYNEKPIANHMGSEDAPEFYIHPNTCMLTIKKEGGVAGEPYVFTVLKDGTKYTETTIVGNGSETIFELPVGTYEIQEDCGWSWRYSVDHGTAVTLNKDKVSGEIICKNTLEKENWLNSFSEVVKNIFGVTNSEGGN